MHGYCFSVVGYISAMKTQVESNDAKVIMLICTILQVMSYTSINLRVGGGFNIAIGLCTVCVCV